MNTFLKNILSSAIGVLLAGFILIGSFIMLIIVSSFIAIFNQGDKIEKNSVVKMEFNYPISDKPNTDPFMNFSPLGDFEPNNSKHLYQILKGINIAAENNNVAGIVLDLSLIHI